MTRYDLLVIGAGPAGEKGAAKAAYFGKRVALIEKTPHVGGAGVNTGTIPSKTLRETALYFSGLRQRGLYGIDYAVQTDLSVQDFMYREQEVVRSLRDVVRDNITRHRIELVRGEAVFEDPHRIRVKRPGGEDRWLEGEVILIATGSVPNRPPNIPFHDRRLHDSDTILQMLSLPRRLGIVGAGVIGCEYATIFAALGAQVSLIDERPRLLSFLDAEISDRLRQQLLELRIDVRIPEGTSDIRPDGDAIRLDLKSSDSISVDSVLFAAGRNGNTEGLGLDTIGITVGPKGHVKVNEHFQTGLGHVYAVGDVIGFPALAATSMEQARLAVNHAFDLDEYGSVASALPLAVYTIPEVAMAGETEESCREKGIPYRVGRAFYRHNARGQIMGQLEGMLKLLVRPQDRALLGVHLIGEGASELIHVGLMVMQSGGTIDPFIRTVFNYPTLGETYKYAAYDALGRLAT